MKNFKDSGIEWLGEIPQHWEVVKIKFLAIFYTGDSIKDSEKHKYCFLNNSIPYISTKDIDINTNVIDYNNGMFIEKNDANFKRAYTNSILLCLEGANAGKKIAFLDKEVCFVNKLCCISSKTKKLNSKFLFYFLQSVFFKNVFIANIKGLIGGITTDQLGNFYMLFPPLKEQEQIANFLDEKCEQIANFIEKKEKLISLLKEQKQAFINETITKGLDKNINFKDSGIEWLGEIPQHWEVKKLKMLFTLGNGLNITKADFVSYGIPCVSYGEIHSKYPCRLNTTIHALPFVSKTYLADKPQSLLQKGDFVFADTSEDIEGSGNFTSIQSDTPIFAGYHTIILKYKGKINSLYFSFLFDSIFTRNQIRKEVCGVKVFSITKSILKEVQCLIPPLKEQEQIANFLDEKCEKIDLLIEKTKKQIKLIKEYKTTLINQAVCGRISL
ncbi:restriction endonuclease subunit S [Campylobacter jejuni]|uniref:Restriction endonuclease subunit S n=2 Tax=Campylobacter jejuni TaxID=197 RepID=A0A6C7S6D6_CAMJU|nr:restriction endonuclease subunit S [Campylobacter jejuni]ECR1329302.1 restriction endonuclease subunit S [Campylobacter coli]EAH7915562.1 restriction endonuclease subunit S [Campylobacter jejuni]EAH8083574.1 restriction endonuclease subunit S [Campylobacter jejuni]EAH8720975.1 restriction endonuclease subunit S [Campylobacter jejuni]